MKRTAQNRQTGRRGNDAASRESATGTGTAREEPLAALHGAGGNQAVGSALEEERESAARKSVTEATAQAKLEVSEPGDRHEALQPHVRSAERAGGGI